MKPKKSNPNSGFTLIESMLSLMIFSLFLLITWRVEQHIFKQVSEVLKDSEAEVQRVQALETRLAYP